MGERIADQVRRALIAAVVSSCAGGGGGDDCHHSCPISTFVVTVPTDRAAYSLVTATGPCTEFTAVYPMSPERRYFAPSDVGVCRITVTFASGAPDFVADVKITAYPGPCCVGQPTAETLVVAVPESPDAGKDGG